MRPWSASLLSLLLVGPLAAQRPRTVIVVPGQMTEVITDTLGTPYELPFPPATMFPALLAVFQELKVPVDLSDSIGLQVGSRTFHKQATFAGRQISTWLSCGDGVTGPNADTYRVYMILNSTIRPKPPERSVVRTVLLAGAVGLSGAANQAMPCESTGRLEVRIHQMLLKKAAGL